VVVKLEFVGREEGETGHGSRGRRARRRKVGSEQGVLADLYVKGRGLVGVRFEDVMPPGSQGLAVSQLGVERLGEPVGFRVEPVGRTYGPGSVLYFYAAQAASSTAFSEEVAYELVRTTQGVGLGVVDGKPLGAVAGTLSQGRSEFEVNRIYNAGLVNARDVWEWDALIGGMTRTEGFTLAGTAPGGGEVAVDLEGGSDSGKGQDHHVRVQVNGTYVGEATFGGMQPYRLELPVGEGVLKEGANTLSVVDVGDTGVYSLIDLDKFSVSYRQVSALRGGVFEGIWGSSGAVEVVGAGSAPVVLDVTGVGGDGAGALVEWVTGVRLVTGGVVRFEAEAGHRYAVVSGEGLLGARVVVPEQTRLRDKTNRADYVVIGPASYQGAVEPLLQRRASQGLAVKWVPFEQVVTEFGHGEPSGEAIREFIAWAYQEWSGASLKYVLLVGDSSFDPRNFRGTSWPVPLPALWTLTSYMWTASDPLLGAVNGEDAVPDVAVGRLPARSVEEAQALVEKVLDFESGGESLGGAAVVVADNPDDAGDFEADAVDIAQSYLQDRSVQVLSLRQLGAARTRSALLGALDGGLGLLSYVGHGGTAVWADERILGASDVGSLQAQSQQPLMVAMNCLSGYFVAPNTESLSEAFLKAQGRGVIGAFSPTGLSLDGPAHQYHRFLMQELTNGQHARLGDAVLAAQKDYALSGAFPELLSIYALLGDPALQIQ
jgi:hypothetical protein